MKRADQKIDRLKRLARLLALHPESQQVIAQKIGIDASTLSRIKKGKSSPSQRTNYRIMELFGVDENYEALVDSTPASGPKVEERRPLTDAEEKARVCAKLAPELILCLYDYLMKQGREGSVTVDSGGVIKKSGA